MVGIHCYDKWAGTIIARKGYSILLCVQAKAIECLYCHYNCATFGLQLLQK